jgi:hypothetical protein
VLAQGTIPELCQLTGTRSLRQAFFALVKQLPREGNDQTA